MRDQDLSYEDVLRIVELVKATQFSEFRLKVGEIEVHLRRKNGAAPQQEPAIQPVTVAAANETPAACGSDRQFAADVVPVRSPMVGTFYRAPAPGATPFVEVGRRVDPDTTVCIIEVMKLMNSIPAEARGLVAEILVENGAAVEYGQALMLIRPDPEDG